MESQVAPSEDARAMGDFILENVDLQRAILLETIESAEKGRIHESGRTICGEDSVLPPLERLPRAVSLQRCPVAGGAGIIHTHVTHDEIRNPQHSLPDIGNVLLEDGIVASMVVGVETSQLLLAPGDRDIGHKMFEEALGTPVDGPRDVENAIRSGRVDNFQAIRTRVFDELSPLFERHDTAHPDLNEQVSRVAVPAASPIKACSMHHDHPQPPVANHPETKAAKFRQRQSSCMAGIRASAEEMNVGSRIRDEAIGAAIGTLVGTSVNRLFFG